MRYAALVSFIAFVFLISAAPAFAVSISSCTNLSTPNTVYELTGDLNSSGTCLTIEAANITIQGNGYTINYSTGIEAGYAINNSNNSNGYDNITITNLTIVQGNTSVSGAHAIYAYGMENSSIDSITVNTSGDNARGIYLAASDFTNITNNNITTAGVGLNNAALHLVTACDYMRITGNNITSSYYVIYFSQGNNNIINANTVLATGSGAALRFDTASSYNNITNNNITAEGSDVGITFLTGSTGSRLTGNAFNTTNAYAISIWTSSQDSTFNHTIDTTNTEKGRPIYYYFSANDTVIEDIDSVGQMFLANSYNVTIRNVTVLGDGITLSRTNGTTITNTTINITEDSVHAIYIPSASNYTNISYNDIVTSGYQANGIRLVGHYNDIIDNDITTTGQYGHGVNFPLSTDSFSNRIINNTITTMSTATQGIDMFHAHETTIYNNIISTGSSSSYSLDLSASNDNMIYRNDITSTSASGGAVEVYNSYNNTLFDNTINITGSSMKGYYIYDSNNTNVSQGSIEVTSATSYHYYLDGAGTTNNFTDTGFADIHRVYFNDATSQFNYNNDSMTGIFVKTNSSAQAFINRTLASWTNDTVQWTDKGSVAGLVMSYSVEGLQADTTYNIVNTTSGDETARAQTTDASGNLATFTVALNGSTQIRLNANAPPQYFDNSTNSTAAGTPTEFSIRWTDDAALSHSIFSLDNGNGTFVNSTPSSLSGTNVWANITEVLNSTAGVTIRWISYANDSAGAWNATEVFSFTTTSSNTAPRYFDNSSNSTEAGDPVKFITRWTDDTALSGCIFSLDNGNGTFVNYSFSAMGGSEAWCNRTETVNATSGASIQWKVYANDSNDAWNVTDTYSFLTNISCKDLTYEGRTYEMTGNLASSGTCFNVMANNVTIDGNGYTINYTTGPGPGYGVNVTGFDNVTIRNVTIILGNSSATYSYAVYLSGSTGANITNNTLVVEGTGTSYSHGIYLLSSGDSNNITGNNITVTGNYSKGILATTGGNMILNNNITTTGWYGDPIELSGSGANIITDNHNITATGRFSYGIRVGSSDNNTIQGNTILIADWYDVGIYLFSCENNTLTGNIVDVTGAVGTYGMEIYACNATNVTGGSIKGSGYNYYLFDAGATNNFTRTNFTASRSFYLRDATSWFNYNNETTADIWLKSAMSSGGYMSRVLVNWNSTLLQWNDSNVSSAERTITYNITGLQADTAYNVYNTSSLGQSVPYNLTTDADGDLSSFTIPLYGDTEVKVEIDSVPKYSSNSTNSTEAGSPTEFRVSWTGALGLSGYILSLDNATGSFSNETWVPMTGTGNWSNATIGINDTAGGTIQWKVYANSTTGKWNVSDTYTFVTESKYPQYFDNSTNSTLKGTPVEFRLRWADNTALSGYIFSFNNGTGSLSNGTWVPMTGTGNWSNLTKVVNATSGVTISWIVYANDSDNNWNASQNYSFVTTTAAAAATEATASTGGSVGGRGYVRSPKTEGTVKILEDLVEGINLISGFEGSVIEEIELNLSEGVEDASLTIKNLTELPEGVGGINNTYESFELELENITNETIESIKIRFSVSKTWLDDNDYDASTITLNRWDGSKWQALPTQFLYETSTAIIYESETRSFSVFTITAEKMLPRGSPELPPYGISGKRLVTPESQFVVIAVLFILLIFIALLFRKKKKRKLWHHKRSIFVATVMLLLFLLPGMVLAQESTYKAQQGFGGIECGEKIKCTGGGWFNWACKKGPLHTTYCRPKDTCIKKPTSYCTAVDKPLGAGVDCGIGTQGIGTCEDRAAPVITHEATAEILSAEISWSTDELATEASLYIREPGKKYVHTSVDTEDKDSWSKTVSGLDADTLYEYEINVCDIVRNCASKTGTFRTKETPLLEITNIQVSPGATSAIISWDTNLDADSKVEYDGSSESSSEYVKEHTMIINGLTPEENYFCDIFSRSKDAQTATANCDFKTLEEDLPDLTITSVKNVQENPRAGDTITPIIYYKNMGTESASGFYIYRDFCGKQGTSDQLTDILPGEEKSYTWDPYQCSAGQQQFYFKIDSENLVEESNEDNNEYSFEVTVLEEAEPNLMVDDIIFSPSTLKVGKKASVTARIKNEGDVDVTFSENSKIAQLTWKNEVIESRSFDHDWTIKKGETREISFLEPVTSDKKGVEMAKVKVDPDDVIDEESETDNELSKGLTFGKLNPDFVPAEIKTCYAMTSKGLESDCPNSEHDPQDIFVIENGENEITFNVIAMNKGDDINYPASDWDLTTINGNDITFRYHKPNEIWENPYNYGYGIYLYTDPPHGTNTDLGYQLIPDGDYDLVISLDPRDLVTETDETNNIVTHTIHVVTKAVECGSEFELGVGKRAVLDSTFIKLADVKPSLESATIHVIRDGTTEADTLYGIEDVAYFFDRSLKFELKDIKSAPNTNYDSATLELKCSSSRADTSVDEASTSVDEEGMKSGDSIDITTTIKETLSTEGISGGQLFEDLFKRQGLPEAELKLGETIPEYKVAFYYEKSKPKIKPAQEEKKGLIDSLKNLFGFAVLSSYQTGPDDAWSGGNGMDTDMGAKSAVPTLVGEQTIPEHTITETAYQNIIQPWTLPVPGTYDLIIKVDPDDTIFERNRENNEMRFTVAVLENPEEVCEYQGGHIIFSPGNVTVGDEASFIASGFSELCNNKTLELRLDDCNGKVASSCEVSNKNCNGNFASEGPSESQDYVLCDTGSYTEYEGSLIVNVPEVIELPDLSISASDIGIIQGDNITTMKIMIENTGLSDVDYLTVQAEIYGTRNIWMIPTFVNAGERNEVSIEWTGAPSGEYTLRVELDPYNSVEEISEYNNLARKSFIVP